MSLVHYKFKSSLEYNNVKFDDQHISVGDLKKEIRAQKRPHHGACELEISDAQTGKVYESDWDLVPRNAVIIVKRLPPRLRATNSRQNSWEAFKLAAAKVRIDHASEMGKMTAAETGCKTAAASCNYMGTHHPGPAQNGYSGPHWRHFPRGQTTFRPYTKRPSGIPTSHLTFVADPLTPGALLTESGHFALPSIALQAYKEGKKERPPFLPQPEKIEPKKPRIPSELACLLCNNLMKDAAIVACCGDGFCDECIRDALLDTENHQCPNCDQCDVSPDKIIPTLHLRMAVKTFATGVAIQRYAGHQQRS